MGRGTGETMVNVIVYELLAHVACLYPLVLLVLNPRYTTSIISWNACGPT